MDVLTILTLPLYYLLLAGLYGALGETDFAAASVGALLGAAGVTLVRGSWPVRSRYGPGSLDSRD